MKKYIIFMFLVLINSSIFAIEIIMSGLRYQSNFIIRSDSEGDLEQLNIKVRRADDLINRVFVYDSYTGIYEGLELKDNSVLNFNAANNFTVSSPNKINNVEAQTFNIFGYIKTITKYSNGSVKLEFDKSQNTNSYDTNGSIIITDPNDISLLYLAYSNRDIINIIYTKYPDDRYLKIVKRPKPSPDVFRKDNFVSNFPSAYFQNESHARFTDLVDHYHSDQRNNVAQYYTQDLLFYRLEWVKSEIEVISITVPYVQ